MRILVIEDNVQLARLVEQGLAARGFHADRMGRLAEADVALGLAHYDAIILDLQLPDGDGLCWLVGKRKIADFPPVLILTARDALGDCIEGLDNGADDYLVKPVDLAELAARLRALIRRPGPRSAPVLQIGSLVYDVAAQRAQLGSAELDLTRKEAELLELFMRRAGTVVRRSVITDALYTFDEAVTPNAIEAIVSRLRQKLASSGGSSLLNTVRGMGYIMEDPRS